MTLARRLLLAAGLSIVMAFIVPMAWWWSGPRGFFEAGRCACGYDIFIQITGDGYFDWCPGHGEAGRLIRPLRQREGELEAFGPEGKAILRLRFQGGDLWETPTGSTNWFRHARVYNLWRVWLPALLTPQPVQAINCINNLKQIGLAFKTWSLDNGDRFPFNVSTNEGGTFEICSPGPDGFDRSAVWHFMTLSNELSTPVILVCPKDLSKRPAADFRGLQPGNVTYLLRSGPAMNDTNSGQILIECPIDGNALYCDGTVKEGKNRNH
jgi:hypothetical protein